MQDENNEIEWRGLFSAKRRRVAVPGTRYIHIVLGKRREIGDGREIVGYEYVLQVFKSASSRSREENSLCMQSRDGEERPDAAEVWFLTKEGALYRLDPEYDKNYCRWSKSRRRKRGAKRRRKKRKSVVWKAVAVFKGQRNEREVPREQWNRFYFPMIPDPVWLLRPFRSNRFLLTFSTRSWNIFAGKRSFFLITEFRRNFVLFSGRRDSETILLVWWRV